FATTTAPASSVTRRTARKSLNLIFVDEPPAEHELAVGRLVVDAEHGVARPHVALRLAMAVDAPFHLQRLLAPHQRHPIDLAVAGRAADALRNVDAVVEVDEVGQIVDARPLQRASRPEALPHGLEVRTVREDLRVAVHAGPGRRDPCKRRVLHRGVAVPAVDAVAGDVALVAELNRLLARDLRLREPRRAIDLIEEVEKGRDEENGAEDADPSNRVRGAVKDLRHRDGGYDLTEGDPSLLPFRGQAEAHFVKCF